MNNYGVILIFMGLEPLVLAIQAMVIQPLARVFFPIIGSEIDSHHTFLVDYAADDGKDKLLDMHHDASDVTFNTCLGYPGFEGSGLTFCGVIGSPSHRHMQVQYQHVIGQCVMHRGAHRHGADTIIKGRRCNLIMWNRSSLYSTCENIVLDANVMVSQGRYEEESKEPDVQCQSVTHDKDHPKNLNTGKGWCPPY